MLATRFSRARLTIDNYGQVISEDQLRDRIPAIFADEAHDSRSSRYAYIPTSEVLTDLRDNGWMPTFATQARPRADDRMGFAKHMIRLRRTDSPMAKQEVPEIILINSHDGTSGYQMLAGMFRFVCCNGMVVGDNVNEIRVRHSGNASAELAGAANNMLEHFDRVTDSVERMRSIELSAGEQMAFSRAAAAIRWEDPEAVNPSALALPRRHEDRDNSLWTVFNRVQENVIRGGVRARAANGARRKSRAVGGIDQNVALNRGLWTLAEQMATLKDGKGELREVATIAA